MSAGVILLWMSIIVLVLGCLVLFAFWDIERRRKPVGVIKDVWLPYYFEKHDDGSASVFPIENCGEYDDKESAMVAAREWAVRNKRDPEYAMVAKHREPVTEIIRRGAKK